MSITESHLFVVGLEQRSEHIAEGFANIMSQLFTEVPEAFEGRTTQGEWENQLSWAQDVLARNITAAIVTEIEKVEAELHDGQFSV